MTKGISYLNSLKPWDLKSPFGLDNLSPTLKALGNPQNSIPSIHVAGTNGKGSVCVGCASVFGASGLKVGLTVSPHLVQANERIVVDGLPISDELLDKALVFVEEASRSTNSTLSYFEAVTAAAFQIFSWEKVDLAVLETGLGGRLDATNVVEKPLVSIITSIDFDHEHFLGNTLAKIAAEKAGIIKQKGRVLLGRLPEEARQVVLEVAKARDAKLFELGADFDVFRVRSDGSCRFKWQNLGVDFEFKPSLKGRFQADNMALVAACGLLMERDVTSIRAGIEQVAWPGRLEEIKFGEAGILIDCAHNPAGVKELKCYLSETGIEKIAFGFGALATKNWKAMIDLIQPLVGEWYLCEPISESAVPASEMADYLSSIGISASVYDKDYFKFLNELSASEQETKVIAGSIYMVGKLRNMILMNNINKLWHKG